MVIPAKFDWAGNFGTNGLAHAGEGDREFVIDRKGDIVASTDDRARAQALIEGRAFMPRSTTFRDPTGATYHKTMHALLDDKGQLLTEYVYDSTRDFSEGLACVQQNDKWGCIDKQSKWVVRPIYDDIRGRFRDGLLPVKKGDHWGLIDNTGAVKCDFKFYDVAYSFCDGFLGVRIGGKCGYIDRTGKYLWEPTE